MYIAMIERPEDDYGAFQALETGDRINSQNFEAEVFQAPKLHRAWKGQFLKRPLTHDTVIGVAEEDRDLVRGHTLVCHEFGYQGSDRQCLPLYVGGMEPLNSGALDEVG
jgi:hypothetical protein